jgi:hypothetical protein
LLRPSDKTAILGQSKVALAHQWQVLERWPDGSAKWTLLDTLVPVCGAETTIEIVHDDRARKPAPDPDPAIKVTCPRASNALRVRNSGNQGDLLCEIKASLLDGQGHEWRAIVPAAEVLDSGPVCSRQRAVASFQRDGKQSPLQMQFNLEVYPAISLVVVEVDVLNPQAALHPGNIWDLGDPGSVRFSDLSVRVAFPDGIASSAYALRGEEPSSVTPADRWTIYQDSSGGERWDSQNHVDHDGKLTVSFKGFKLIDDRSGDTLRRGERAQPLVTVQSPGIAAAISMEDFWQNFPSAIRVRRKHVELGLFAGESKSDHELQGGERKRHRFHLAIAEDPAAAEQIVSAASRVEAWVDARWIESTGVIPWFTSADTADSASDYEAYIDTIVSGPLSFDKRREVIDEYGWRNYGDLYADHEAVNEETPGSLISHYNNQYDFVHGAALHALRNESAEWWHLMRAAARHHIDIDVYHTTQDRPAYNQGLFWHTEHYRSAGTATHRTYSALNKTAKDYGGGPSNEHNYTSGLTLYYFLTGDTFARDVVIGMADWVINMDDGATTIWSIIDPVTPTGLSSRTKTDDYHGPGRGAGNSVNALLDAYSLSTERRYLDVAEQFIRRCIHPEDDFQKLDLDSPEERWSYLVFLQVLGRYLWTKEDLGEFDFHYYYARDSLLHYADWVASKEKPYSELFDKVDLPTETWPAQDIRKAHVLFLASEYAAGDRHVELKDKAQKYFAQCLADLLKFDTAYLCRPRVLLAVYGHVRDYFVSEHLATHSTDSECARQDYSYDKRSEFVPQRANLATAFRQRLSTIGKELARLLPTPLRLLFKRLGSLSGMFGGSRR